MIFFPHFIHLWCFFYYYFKCNQPEHCLDSEWAKLHHLFFVFHLCVCVCVFFFFSFVSFLFCHRALLYFLDVLTWTWDCDTASCGIRRCLGSRRGLTWGLFFFSSSSRGYLRTSFHPVPIPPLRPPTRESELCLIPGRANLPKWHSVNCLCPFFSSRLWLTRKVEITNAWALCLGGLAKKEQKKRQKNWWHFITATSYE